MHETQSAERENTLNGPVLSEWMTRADLACELGLAVDTLAKWATAGIGPVFIRIGARTYYRRSTVRDWLVGLEEQQNTRRAR